MGKRVVVDTAVVTQQAWELRALSYKFKFEVKEKAPDLMGSMGDSVRQLEDMYKIIYETKQNVEQLIDKTIEFLDQFSETTDLSDKQNMSAVSSGSGSSEISRSW